MIGWRRATARPLTSGEVELARSIFGAALDTSRVCVHARAYLPGQAKRVAMTPNGEVWFRPEDHKPDFSRTVGDSAWLVHELVHAWQFQTGRSVRLRGLLEQVGRLFGRNPYLYGLLDPMRPYRSYNNEQQAAIVEDYFRIGHGLAARFGEGAPADYRAAIPFLPD